MTNILQLVNNLCNFVISWFKFYSSQCRTQSTTTTAATTTTHTHTHTYVCVCVCVCIYIYIFTDPKVVSSKFVQKFWSHTWHSC